MSRKHGIYVIANAPRPGQPAKTGHPDTWEDAVLDPHGNRAQRRAWSRITKSKAATALDGAAPSHEEVEP